MKRLLIACLNLFLLFNSVNYQIINAEEPSTDNIDNTSLITEENDTNSSNEENNNQENDSTNEDNILTINSSSEDESSTDNTSLTTEKTDINTSNEENPTKENDSTNESVELTINDLSEDESISTIVGSSTQSLYITELNTLLKNINVTDLYFGLRSDYPAVDFSTYTKYNLKNNYELYYYLDSSTGLSKAYVTSSNDEQVVFPENCLSMFANLKTLKQIHFDNINTEHVTNMSWMFANCNNLTYVDISKLNTINVKDVSSMFRSCESITSLDLSNFKTANVTNMGWMFTECKNLTSVNISNFDTQNVTDMSHMFYKCNNLSNIDVSNFNTAKVTNMLGMFSTCLNLNYIDISKFNTENVTNMSWMFASCEKLSSLDISNFNTEKVTNMEGMFSSLTVNTLDLSSFKTANVTNMGRMFFKCKNLNTIYATTDFVVPNNSENMFYSCTSLKGEKGTKFSSNKVHGEYARIDDGIDNPGYFSIKHPVKPTLSVDNIYTYTGSEQSVVIDGFDNATMDIEGNTATVVGNYTVTVKSKNGKWSDGTKEPVTFNWFIVKANPSYTLPTGLNAVQGDKLSDVTLPDGWTWNTPETQLTNAGSNTYKATFTPSDTDNYNVLTDIDVTVIVEPAPVKPTNNTSNKKPNGWDDGGPFTTDKCGNVFDRWNNKIYEANGCNVGGYNLVRTSVED